MLPFLKHKPVAGLIISKRSPDEPAGEESHQEHNEMHALEACAEDILRAITAKDAKALASALKASHELCEGYSDENSNDFDSMNEKAAQEDQE